MAADVAELVPKANYALGRGVVTSLFKNFMSINVSHISDAKDYRAFIKHFEAVIAYIK